MRQQWEYTTATVPLPDHVAETFNKLGAEGWECFAVHMGKAFFKREIGRDVSDISIEEWLKRDDSGGIAMAEATPTELQNSTPAVPRGIPVHTVIAPNPSPAPPAVSDIMLAADQSSTPAEAVQAGKPKKKGK